MFTAVLSLSLLLASGLAGAKPSDIALCETYRAVNSAHQCSSDNYLIKFGYKYCRKYVRLEHTYQAETQRVLKRIRSCLVTMTVNDSRLTCSNSEARAMQHHLSCYVKAGFCKLPKLEILKIGAAAKAELVHESFRETMAAVARRCY